MKFIDLRDAIRADHGWTRAAVESILEWLDDHPELTGRDRTESELKAISGRTQVSPWAVRAVTTALGHGVIPDSDPKPTNAEKWEAFIRESDFRVSGFFGNDATKALSQVLDARGVVAPRDDDAPQA